MRNRAAKLSRPRDEYFLVQSTYFGWAWFVRPILAALAANVALFVLQQRQGETSARYALGAASLILLSLIVFFVFVLPGNQETANWTTHLPTRLQTHCF